VPLDFATRAAMLAAEVEAVARMDHLSQTDGASLNSMLSLTRTASDGGGLPWLSGMLPGSSNAPNVPIRRDISRERAERRALSAPIPPRNAPRSGRAAPSQPERSKSRGVSLNESSSSSPQDPTPPKTPGSENGAPEPPLAAQHEPPPPPLANQVRWSDDEWSDRLERKKTAAERIAMSDARGGSGWGGVDDGHSPLNLSKCVSLLDEDDLAGLAAAEQAFLHEERAKRLVMQVQEAASKALPGIDPEPARPPPEPEPRHPSPLPPAPDSSRASPSPFFGVELSLD